MFVICSLFCFLFCLQAGAHVIGGPPCSSWIWLSRGSTKRCRLRPQGSKRHPGVKKSNKLARRLLYLNLASTNRNGDTPVCAGDICVLFILLLALHALRLEAAHKRGCFWTIEQPRSSLLAVYKPFKERLQFLWWISGYYIPFLIIYTFWNLPGDDREARGKVCLLSHGCFGRLNSEPCRHKCYMSGAKRQSLYQQLIFLVLQVVCKFELKWGSKRYW